MNINTNIANPIFDLVVKYIIVDANVVIVAPKNNPYITLSFNFSNNAAPIVNRQNITIDRNFHPSYVLFCFS